MSGPFSLIRPGARGSQRVTREPLFDTLASLPKPSDLRSVIGPSGLQISAPRYGPALPAPLVTRPLKPSQPSLAGDAAYPQLAPVLDSGTDMRPFYARPAFWYITPGTPAADTGGLRTYGALGIFPTHIDGKRITFAGLLDAGSATFRLSGPDGVYRVGPLAAIGDGYAWAGATATTLSHNVLTTWTAGFVGWSDTIGAQLRWGHLNMTTGVYGLAGGSASLSGSRSVDDLGYYHGPDLGALARWQGFGSDAPMRHLELTVNHGRSANVTGGGGILLIGGQGRLGWSQRWRTQYRSYRAPLLARGILCEKPGLRRYWRNVRRAARLAPEPLPPPDTAQPLRTMKLGDEVAQTRSNTVLVGASVGNIGVWAGAQALAQRDRELRVRRLGEAELELDSTRTQLKGYGVFAFSPLSPQATANRSQARSLRQAFVFNMQEPAAAVSYQQALKGNLPGTLPDTAYGSTVKMRIGNLQGCDEKLAPGVKRLYAQSISAHELRVGGGAHFYLIPRAWLPRGWEPGFALHKIWGREKQALFTGDAFVLQRSRGQEVRSECGPRGRRSIRVSATHYLLRPQPGMFFEAGELTLDAVVSGSYRRAVALNKRLIAPVNNLFRLGILPLQRQAHRQVRELQLTRRLNADDLEELAEWSAAARRGAPMDERLQLAYAAFESGVSYKKLTGFLATLAANSETTERMYATARFVQHGGIKVYAAVHHLLGGRRDTIKILSTSDVYSDALALAALFTLEFTAPHVCWDRKRWAHVRGVLEAALLDLRQDGLVPESDRAVLERQLLQAQRDLADVAVGIC